MDENQSKNTLFAEFLTNFILFPQRIVRFLTKKSNISISLNGPLMKFHPQELKRLWQEFETLSYTKKPSLFLRTLLKAEESLSFDWENMGLSRIYWKKEWKAQSYANSILLRIATLYFHSERIWMLTFLEEFSFFVEGRERWNTYLSFRETKKTPLPADHFEISKSYILELSIPYEDAASVILDQIQPASFQQGNVKLIVVHSLIQGISYPLWSENFETKKDIWLRDFFLNVRSINDSNPSAPYWHYIGSNYSNEILTQACLHLKMKRKLIHWKLKIDLVDDRCSVIWNLHPTITLNRTKKNIHLTNDSRMRGSKLIETYQTQSNSNPITCTIWTGGIYDLDIQRMDLPPIHFST